MPNELPRIRGRCDVGDAEEAIPRARLVKKGTALNGLVFADATDRPIGASLNPAAAAGDPVEYSQPGENWVELTASAAIAAGVEFMGANDGKIATLPTSGGGTKDALGILHPRTQAATADDDVVIGRLYDTPITRTIAT